MGEPHRRYIRLAPNTPLVKLRPLLELLTLKQSEFLLRVYDRVADLVRTLPRSDRIAFRPDRQPR